MLRARRLAGQAAVHGHRAGDCPGSVCCDPDGPGGPGVADRRVSVNPAAEPGLVELVALLPEADALAIRATRANTCSLCRRHHRLKTHAPGWTLTAHPDGQATWTTPTGQTITTQPADHRPPDHRPPDPTATPDYGPDDPDPPPF